MAEMYTVYDSAGGVRQMTADDLARIKENGGILPPAQQQKQRKTVLVNAVPVAANTMRVTVYSPEGKEVELYPIDAQEAVRRSGYSYSPKEKGGNEQKPSETKEKDIPAWKDADGKPRVLTDEEITREELVSALQDQDVVFRTNANKAALLSAWNSYASGSEE